MVKEDLPFVGYHNLSSRTSKYFKRDGAEVEKGVVLTEPYLEKHQKEIYILISLVIAKGAFNSIITSVSFFIPLRT